MDPGQKEESCDRPNEGQGHIGLGVPDVPLGAEKGTTLHAGIEMGLKQISEQEFNVYSR